MLRPGLYEQIITEALGRELSDLPTERVATGAIDGAEAAQLLSAYVAEVTRRALERAGEGRDVAAQIALVNRLITQASGDAGDAVDGRAEQLLALLQEKDALLTENRSARDLPRPETSLCMSSLFTGAVHEPQMFSELKKEIASADRIDMLVSFVKWSGLALILDELGAFARRGGRLRVITTAYMGATDPKAVETLATLPGAQVRVSYDTKRTRLHAKSYVFYRDTGFTTAYIGSSNLSNAAISSGLEWNLKITAKDQAATLAKITATFDSYWHSEDFELYGEGERERLKEALQAERSGRIHPEFLFDIRPYPYQQEILDRLQAEREVRGHNRNLVVAATGTGKTVIAALDYRRFRKRHPGGACRLLFIAHREEILRQSRETFAGVLKDVNFGRLYVGGYRPEDVEHLFVSVQTLNSQALWEKLPADYYDFIVVDETHHAAARSYERAMHYFKPQILLGLTATPERLDGRSILDFFDGRIAAEIRLPEAIDRKLLCPFHYFGVSDTVDLDALKWTRGGYDREELSRLYSFTRSVSEKRADHVLRCLDRYVADMDDVRALGFCVSVEHARFMADYANAHGVPAMALVGESAEADRHTARERLVCGELKILFVVDIYNEGVDIPEVNTVLFLRPTESLTIFLQQLGRGLRLSEGKDCLTVLDFIGAANRRYDFAQKFAALLSSAHRSVSDELRRGFPNVPKGCCIQLERKAQSVILDNIRAGLNGRGRLVASIASFEEDSGLPLTLENFLRHHHMDARDIYARYSFSRLCAEAGVRPDFEESAEAALTKAFARVCAIDSRRWIGFLLDFLTGDMDASCIKGDERRLLAMFCMTVWQSVAFDRLCSLKESPVMRAELIELLKYNLEQIDFIDAPADLPYDCPLDVHCRYTRDQLLTALDFEKPATVREGVKYLSEKQTDVLMITLNKSEKEYSPTTMYEDYSINETLFHWQSQSTTSADSATGRRYIHHRAQGSHILLFVREGKRDNCGAQPYTFLGEADYVRHEGSRPMSILWRLRRPIPAKYLRKTRQALG